MNTVADSDSDSEEERVSYETVVKRVHVEDLSLWDICDICDDLREYARSSGIAILDSREADSQLYELLRPNCVDRNYNLR